MSVAVKDLVTVRTEELLPDALLIVSFVDKSDVFTQGIRIFIALLTIATVEVSSSGMGHDVPLKMSVLEESFDTLVRH